MKIKLLICLIVSLLMCTSVSAVFAQSTTWLSIEDQFFVVKYTEGHLSDAQMILEYCEYARNLTQSIYPHQLSHKVTVYLHDNQDWSNGPGYAYADIYEPSIHFLTPSDVPQDYKSYIDKDWYQKNIVHEYIHLPTAGDLSKLTYVRLNGGAYPHFLSEGIAEYVAVFQTTPQILQKYSYYTTEMRNTITSGGSVFFQDSSEYKCVTYYMKYIYETYGKEKTALIFKTDGNTVWDSLSKALGVSAQQFEANWISWIHHEFNVDIPAGYLKDEELQARYLSLEKNYTALDSQYSKLSADSQQLNNNYSKLQSDYHNLQESKSTLQTDYDLLNANYDNLQANSSSLKADYDTLSMTNDRLAAELGYLEANYTVLKADYDNLNSDYSKAKEDIESTNQELAVKNAELSTKNAELLANANLSNQLGNATNFIYILIATTATFLATTAYLLKKKQK